jgi:hypothetical protein
VKHLQACVNKPEAHMWLRTLAAARLRELKAQP